MTCIDRILTATLVGFLVVRAAAPCSAFASQDVKVAKPLDQSSPQRIAEEFTAAAKANDWKRISACITSESRRTLATVMLVAASFGTIGDKAKQKSLQELINKHGMGKKDFDPKILQDSKKMATVFSALDEWIVKNAAKVNGKAQPRFSTQFVSAKFVNFKVHGDVATADSVTSGKKSPNTTYFKRVGGKWYVDHHETAKHSKSGLKIKRRRQ
jgi:hypothetical protein